MRKRGSAPIRSMLLAVALTAGVPQPGLGPVPARGAPIPDTAQDSAAPSCSRECRGLGIEKVKAGDEHCGLISRERKDEALDAACGLAESHREKLHQLAEEKAWQRCSTVRDRPDCRCETELRSWKNVYTQVFSQRCWAECGWAFLIECDRRPEEDG